MDFPEETGPQQARPGREITSPNLMVQVTAATLSGLCWECRGKDTDSVRGGIVEREFVRMRRPEAGRFNPGIERTLGAH